MTQKDLTLLNLTLPFEVLVYLTWGLCPQDPPVGLGQAYKIFDQLSFLTN